MILRRGDCYAKHERKQRVLDLTSDCTDAPDDIFLKNEEIGKLEDSRTVRDII